MTRLTDIKALPASEAVRKLNPDVFSGPSEMPSKESLVTRHAVTKEGKPLKAERPPGPRYRSKWEAQFHEVLKSRFGHPDWVEHEPMKLKLANGAYYTPDFAVHHFDSDFDHEQGLVFYEVKGFWREAARVRIKVAARLFPWAKFIAVVKRKKRDGGGWDEEEFAP